MISFRQLLLTLMTIYLPQIVMGRSSLSESISTVDIVDTIHLSIYASDVLCHGEFTGSVTSIVTGSSGYTYLWAGPNGFSSDQPSIAALEAGYYYLTVTDVASDTATASIEVLQPASMINLVLTGDTLCYGTSNGVVSVAASGGTPPYDYLWSNTQTDTFATGLGSGLHYVTVTDAHDCQTVGEVEIFLRPEIQIHAHTTPAHCYHAYDGEAMIDSIVYDGMNMPLTGYSFTWNTVPAQHTADVQGLLGGEFYKITVSDDYGCDAIKILHVGQPDSLQIIVDEVVPVSCFEGNDGGAVVHATGGTTPYIFTWSAGTGNQTGNNATGLATGNYQVTVVDTFLCAAEAGIGISEPEKLYSTVSVENALCKDGASGSATVTVGGGMPPYFYQWTNGDETNHPEGLLAGTFLVTITDLNGCSLLDSAVIDEPETTVTATFIPHDVTCYGGFDGSVDVIASGGTPGYEISTDGINFIGTDLLIALEAGEQVIYVRDDNGCLFAGTAIINEPLPVIVDLGNDTTIELGQDITLYPEIQNAAGEVTYQWTAMAGFPLSCDDCPNPSTQNLTYSANYELLVTDTNNCKAKDVIGITVLKDRVVMVPTAFSPNDDYMNDLLLVHGKPGTTILLFQIFDKKGELVYEAHNFPVNDQNTGWNGIFRGTKMNSGVFAWYLKAKFIDGEEKTYSGTTVLVR